MKFVVYPPEPSIGEKVAVMLQMNSENDLVRTIDKWMIPTIE